MTLSDVEANDLAVRSFRAGFVFGLEAGAASVAEDLARAEYDADFWYFEANNTDEARARRAEISSTTHLDVRAARAETATRLAALDAAGRKAS